MPLHNLVVVAYIDQEGMSLWGFLGVDVFRFVGQDDSWNEFLLYRLYFDLSLDNSVRGVALGSRREYIGDMGFSFVALSQMTRMDFPVQRLICSKAVHTSWSTIELAPLQVSMLVTAAAHPPSVGLS